MQIQRSNFGLELVQRTVSTSVWGGLSQVSCNGVCCIISVSMEICMHSEANTLLTLSLYIYRQITHARWKRISLHIGFYACLLLQWLFSLRGQWISFLVRLIKLWKGCLTSPCKLALCKHTFFKISMLIYGLISCAFKGLNATEALTMLALI